MRLDSHPYLDHAYPARIEALKQLAAAASSKGNSEALEESSASMLKVAETLGDSAVAPYYKAFAKLVEAAARLERWKMAVRGADGDADRFLRSAKEIAKEAMLVAPAGNSGEMLRSISSSVQAILTIEDAVTFPLALTKLSLPLPILARPKRDIPINHERRAARKDLPSPEVFLEFSLDGQPFASPQIVSPGQLHDMSVAVVVRNWPVSADRLLIHPTSVEQDGICTLPEFSFPRPADPREVSAAFQGRLTVAARQSITARPLEYCYRADFLPNAGPTRPIVSGNARLEIRSFDPALNPVSGYREVDLKLLEIRDAIRKNVMVDDRQLADFLTVMTVLGKVAGGALKNAEFKGRWNEKQFQDHLRGILSAEPTIGSALEEHPSAAGGITDLSFRQIRIELKTESEKVVDLQNAMQYTNQTAQYVAGSDRRLGVLCVLDCSQKMSALGQMANDLGVTRVLPPNPTPNTVPTTLGVVIVRGNLTSPSKL